MVTLGRGGVSYERGNPVSDTHGRHVDIGEGELSFASAQTAAEAGLSLRVVKPNASLQGYLAHKKQPPPSGPPWSLRHSPTVESYRGALSYARSTPVVLL